MKMRRRSFIGFGLASGASATINPTQAPIKDTAGLSAEQLEAAKALGIQHIQNLFYEASSTRNSGERSTIYIYSSPERSRHWQHHRVDHYQQAVRRALEPSETAMNALAQAVDRHKELFGEVKFGQILKEDDEWNRWILKERCRENLDKAIDANSIKKLWNSDDYIKKAKLCDEFAQLRTQLVQELQRTNPNLDDARANELVGNAFKRVAEDNKKNPTQTLHYLKNSGADEVQKETKLDLAEVTRREATQTDYWGKSIEENPSILSRRLRLLGGNKAFLPLSDRKEVAENKLHMLNEMIGTSSGRSNGLFMSKLELQKMQHDIITSEVFLTDQLPDDRFVPVPTQRYHDTYGIEISYKQFEAIEGFMKEFPTIAKELAISDFGLKPQPNLP